MNGHNPGLDNASHELRCTECGSRLEDGDLVVVERRGQWDRDKQRLDTTFDDRYCADCRCEYGERGISFDGSFDELWETLAAANGSLVARLAAPGLEPMWATITGGEVRVLGRRRRTVGETVDFRWVTVTNRVFNGEMKLKTHHESEYGSLRLCPRSETPFANVDRHDPGQQTLDSI